MERWDIAVVGTGPAGISAAVTATVRGKRVLLLGSRDLSQKMRKAHTVSGVFVLRDAVQPGQLVPGLEQDGAHVKVDRDMATQIPGLFACGDITGTPYQFAKAVGEGNVAALSAVKYLAGLGETKQ